MRDMEICNKESAEFCQDRIYAVAFQESDFYCAERYSHR
ncbi:Uncharacterized protein dnm_069640 [Desulfonema magnum]|uniref:Uncharacterized protein n=1 Tax=Desulfonema magnum TaxID=45655 RepID=A0A975BSZ8_9BACT|nr:Uncharacterized protein dnm_069640 [Desulfonema magnum]